MGLDLSLTGTGIAVLDEDGTVRATARDGWTLDRSASVIDKIDRLVHIASTVMALVREHGPGPDALTVGIEGYAYSQGFGGGALADLGELGGIVKTQLWLGAQNAPRIVAVTTARALVFANGHLKKKLVQPLLAERGLVFGDPDIADAYVIAEALRKQHQTEANDGEGSDGGTGRRARGARQGGGRRRGRR
jgi:hypothetical protein